MLLSVLYPYVYASFAKMFLVLVTINYEKHLYCRSMIKCTIIISKKKKKSETSEHKQRKRGVMKPTVHLHGTLQNYLKHAESHHVPQE